jgi:hypothetical protein
MYFAVTPLSLEFERQGHLQLSRETILNRFRGALGAALRRRCPPDCPEPEQCPHNHECLYSKFFAPHRQAGPSGYRDAPRPFVLRCGDPGESSPWRNSINLFLFESEPLIPAVEDALGAAVTSIPGAKIIYLRRGERLCFPVEGSPLSGQLRLRFATPIELKGEGEILTEPSFPVLIARLAERVWALGRLYQGWTAALDFETMRNHACQTRLLDWNWKHATGERRSARSGQLHSIGGFTGWAEYRGPVGCLLPLLEIGRWTGVGRQTVWGKGDLRVERFTPD